MDTISPKKGQCFQGYFPIIYEAHFIFGHQPESKQFKDTMWLNVPAGTIMEGTKSYKVQHFKATAI